MRVSRLLLKVILALLLLVDFAFVYRRLREGPPVQVGGGGTLFLEPVRASPSDWAVLVAFLAMHLIVILLLFRRTADHRSQGG